MQILQAVALALVAVKLELQTDGGADLLEHEEAARVRRDQREAAARPREVDADALKRAVLAGAIAASSPIEQRRRTMAKIQAVVDAASPDIGYEAVLLGYARCNDGLVGLKARQIPLGPVAPESLPEEVKQLTEWVTPGPDLEKLYQARTECLRWLKSEYFQ